MSFSEKTIIPLARSAFEEIFLINLTQFENKNFSLAKQSFSGLSQFFSFLSDFIWWLFWMILPVVVAGTFVWIFWLFSLSYSNCFYWFLTFLLAHLTCIVLLCPGLQLLFIYFFFDVALTLFSFVIDLTCLGLI